MGKRIFWFNKHLLLGTVLVDFYTPLLESGFEDVKVRLEVANSHDGIIAGEGRVVSSM